MMSTSAGMREDNVVVSGKEITFPRENDSALDSNTLVALRGGGGGEGETGDVAPLDDCCSICFGSFTVPCKSNCGHWYFGSCILQYWNYCAASRPCKCPLCACRITELTPQTPLDHFQQEQEQDATQVLLDVQRYNRMFVGGIRGTIQSPFIVKRMFQQMMDPDISINDFYLNELLMRLFALFLSLLSTAALFNFILSGGFKVHRTFDYAATAIVVILRLVGMYRRWQLTRHVMQLDAAEPLVD